MVQQHESRIPLGEEWGRDDEEDGESDEERQEDDVTLIMRKLKFMQTADGDGEGWGTSILVILV